MAGLFRNHEYLRQANEPVPAKRGSATSTEESSWSFRVASRWMVSVEVGLRLFCTAAEIELAGAVLRRVFFQATVLCTHRCFRVYKMLRQVPRLVSNHGYEVYSVILLLLSTITMTGCSVRKFAVNKLGDSLSIDRAYQLNPDYDDGFIDQFLISYESARQGLKGDYSVLSKVHFDRDLRDTRPRGHPAYDHSGL